MAWEDLHFSETSMPTKEWLSQCLLAQESALLTVEVCQESPAIAAYVSAMPTLAVSCVVTISQALPQEVQTEPPSGAKLQQQKCIVVSALQPQERPAVQLLSLQIVLQRRFHSILEPYHTHGVINPEHIDCIYVPSVAFDRRSGLLGFGEDILRSPSPVCACYCRGGCFGLRSPRIILCVNQMHHDIHEHVLVTDQGVIPCERVLLEGQDVL